MKLPFSQFSAVSSNLRQERGIYAASPDGLTSASACIRARQQSRPVKRHKCRAPGTDSTFITHHATCRAEAQSEGGSRITEQESRITHPRSSRFAFTLIEIMIAIGIFSMVLAAIYSAWTAILRSSSVGRQAAASIQRARITIRILEDSLSSAQMFLGNRRSNYYAFEAENGDEPRLSFVARLSKAFPRGGKFGDLDVRRLTYSLEAGPDNSRQLVLRQYPILMGDEAFDERDRPLVLAKNVKSFEFQFWDSRLNDWTDEWKPVNQLPRLVMVTLTFLDNPNSTSARETVTRIVNIPSLPVQPGWQPLNLSGAGPQGIPPGGNPQGGVPPGGVPPGGVPPGGVPPGGIPPGGQP